MAADVKRLPRLTVGLISQNRFCCLEQSQKKNECCVLEDKMSVPFFL